MPLSQEKLVSVLMDVHVAESAILHLPDNQKDSLLTKYYDQLCTIHEVKRNDLDTCINRLKSDPFLAETMYGKVLTGLEKLNIDR